MADDGQDEDRGGDGEAYGARFLAELDRLSGTRSCFPYAVRQAFKTADQERMVEVLREEYSLSMTYHHAQIIRTTEDPHELARFMFAQGQQAAMAWAFVFASIT